MSSLLDKSVWFWMLEVPEKIPIRAISILRAASNLPFGLSAISMWEVAKQVEKGRIRLTVPVYEWMEKALNKEFIELIPLTRQIAIDSTLLPGEFHSDPADQIIAASTRFHDAVLITADKRLQAYQSVKTIWK